MTISKAIILSAGQGSRLLPLTSDMPKCMIDFNGRTLIEWQLEALKANGIRHILIVTGFRTQRVESHLAQVKGVEIETIFNPFYQVADNLGSCWIARHAMDRDFIILNGDTIVSDEIVAKLIDGARWLITVTIDIKDAYDEDDMKVHREGEKLMSIGKRLSADVANAESIGMLAFRGEGPAIFRKQVEKMMCTPEGVERWYLRAIDMLALEQEIGTVSIQGLEWAEVDFPHDVEIARALTRKWVDEGRYRLRQ